MTRASMTEDVLVAELRQSRRELLAGRINAELLETLKKEFPNAYSTAYIIEWIPEQTEEIFTVVVGGRHVAIVEVSRLPAQDIQCEVLELDEYLKRNRNLTKPGRRKLELALELSG